MHGGAPSLTTCWGSHCRGSPCDYHTEVLSRISSYSFNLLASFPSRLTIIIGSLVAQCETLCALLITNGEDRTDMSPEGSPRPRGPFATGAKVADLPAALGLKIPPSVLGRADRMIE